MGTAGGGSRGGTIVKEHKDRVLQNTDFVIVIHIKNVGTMSWYYDKTLNKNSIVGTLTGPRHIFS